MVISSTHPDYDASAALWSRARDVLAGEDAVKAAGEKYLPRLDSQSDEEYAAYKARASLFGAAARTTFDSPRIGMKAVPNANAHHAVKMRSSVTARRFRRKRASRRPGASVRKMYLISQSALLCETQAK